MAMPKTNPTRQRGNTTHDDVPRLRVGFVLLLAALVALALPARSTRGEPPAGAATQWAEIRAIDAATGRGVPLVELETVNSLSFVTDNAGRVAFYEPGLMDREVYFSVRSHGYEVAKDGFGFAGVRITPRAGEVAEVKLTRRNLAERLCRLTGEGLYRDSSLLGHQRPLAEAKSPGLVAGQDSVQAVVHRDRVFWFWGDTQRMSYPLGLFRTAGATTPRFNANAAAAEPAAGIAFNYFVNDSGFARAMMPLAERPEGVIWIVGVCTVSDEKGAQKLVAHYSRRKGLGKEYEQGIAVFNDEKAEFESARQLPLNETWRRPSGHPIVHEDGGQRWLLFGSPNPNVRVPATLAGVLDPARYEAYTCAQAARDGKPSEPQLDSDGTPVWRWQQKLPPVDSKTEQEWVRGGKLKAEHARFLPADALAPAERVVLHSGSVRWNEHRRRWVLVAGQIGGRTSLLGEVWYAEAAEPTGPFAKAVKVVTHERQSFYNVCHHAFLDRDSGRTIHFEGTYTSDFSGNPHKTPRYNYNQVLYRLDLESAGLRAARE
jgi:hypothetical protein